MDPLSDVILLLEPRNYRVGGFEAGGDWSIRFGGCSCNDDWLGHNFLFT
jgi:hypothetical protein